MLNGEIRWVDCYASKKIHLSVIQEFENKFGVKLPDKYKDIISEYNTTYPEVKSNEGQWQNGKINIKNFKKFSFFFIEFKNSINDDDFLDVFHFVEKTSNFNSNLSKLIPFARSNGHLFYFDYRNNKKEPSIVLQKNIDDKIEEYYRGKISNNSFKELFDKNSIYYIADNFDEFLKSIEPEGNFRWGEPNEIDISIIRNFEEQKGIKFPEEYIELVKEYDGGEPEFLDFKGRWQPAVVNIGNNEEKSICLLAFKKKVFHLLDMFEANENVDKIKLITFAIDSKSCEYFFDFDQNKKNPPILFYNCDDKPGRRYRLIASSFKDLVNNLKMGPINRISCFRDVEIEQDEDYIKKMYVQSEYFVN